MNKQQILIVDDEESIRVTIQAHLKQLGYSVTIAKNGNEALFIIKNLQTKFDLIILDMIMPVMNGIECFSELQAIKSKTPVIFTSGLFDAETTKQLKDIGRHAWISKPFRLHTLSNLISKMLH